MTLQEAIEARHSVRAYKDKPLSDEVVKVLEDEIVKLNRRSSEYHSSSLGNGRGAKEEGEANDEGQLHIQLVCNEPKAFQGTLAKSYIAIGYGETQGTSHKIKTVERVSNAGETTPSWFKRGVEAALLAPTAVNQQKFSFEYLGMKDGRHQVRAKKGIPMIDYTQMDLGIAKYHFEIGAGKVNFEWV